MPTSRAFAFNTGTTISGTEQVGSIAVNSATTLSGNVVWWAGPDEDLGYVVAQAVSGGTMTGANGQPAYLGFYRSTTLTNDSFISLANYLAQGQQVFTSGAVAKSWLNSNGYWTSYVFNGLSTISTNGDNAFGMGLDASGNLFTWGNNDIGQLGRNSTQSTFIPVSVCGAKKTFCKISAGYNFATAIDKNGQIWTWGSSSTAQLGNNSSANSKSTPSKISGAQKTFCNIATLFTSTFVLAIDKYGQVWSWGGGFASGQLGNNSTLPASTPVSVCGAKKTFCQVVANQQTSYGLDQYGQVWSWGGGVQGSLGNNSIVSYSTPISICGAKKTFCQITIAAAIDKYGQVWCWGSNLSGFLGNNSTVSTSTPVSVCGARKTFCSIATFPNTHAAIDNYGRLWVWGSNSDYVIGSSSSSTPILIEGGTKTFCKVFGTGRVGFAQTYNNINWSWGKNSFGVRAIGFAMPNLTPVAICGATKTFCKINMRNFATFGITSTGKLYSWGSNTSGVLGTNDSTAICRQTPVSIYNFANTYCVVSTAPTSTVYAIDNTGLVWSWGAGGLGQLGINSTDLRCTPGSILGLRKTFCKIEGGSNFVLGLDKNGLIWAWGQGIFGKLGIGAAANRSTPVSVCGALKTFCHIAASTSNGYGIDKYGQVWAWGVATSGQLGDNQIVTAANTPISVCGVKKTFCQISAGQLMVAAIDKYGQVWTWGSNNVGQLGNNSTSNASTPVSICGNKKTFCKIFTAGTIVAAIDNYGKFWSWGDNTFGSFGNQLSNQNASTPISVCGAVKTFCEIATSITDGSVAIDKNGIIWSWGQDLYGQLGHNYTFRTPLMICE